MGSAKSHRLTRKGENHDYYCRWHRSRQARFFAGHGVDAAGRAGLVRPSVARVKLHELIATLPPCLIGMEACTGARHWARLFLGTATPCG
jgi:transposase